MTQTPTDALIEKGQNRALCDAAQAILERDYTPRPGRSGDTAPNGARYGSLKTRFYATAGEAVRELEGQLRSVSVANIGDTVWWRVKPEVEFEIQNKKWQARASLAVGWLRDQKPEFMPNRGFPAVYPMDGAGVASTQPGMGGQLPTWKCHKVVQADKIIGVSGDPLLAGPRRMLLDCGVEVAITDALYQRFPTGDYQSAVGGYFVRYLDGHESWSPREAFEEGYERISL